MVVFGDRELISITGAGGKTSLALALCSRLSRTKRVLLTTTTRMGVNEIPRGMDLLVGNFQDVLSALRKFREKSFCKAIARGIEGDKLVGFSGAEVDSFYESDLAGYMVVEADGAKGFPVKGYAEFEPVIPGLSTCQIVVVGAEIFTEPLSEKTVFRFPLFLAAAGFTEGSRPGPESISSILENPMIFLKDSLENKGMKRVLFINKMDLISSKEQKDAVKETLLRLRQYDMACTGALGWGGHGSPDSCCWKISANGNEQAAFAVWEGDSPFHCCQLRG
ncbi:MAG: selenium cofactor biosynthesis protein YqeC [Synergistales bacterium]